MAHDLAPQGPHIVDYRKWVKGQFARHACRVDDGQQENGFISLSDLKAYLGPKIPDILRETFPAHSYSPVRIDDIDPDYLKVFAILTYIGRANLIEHCTSEHQLKDQYLPFLSKPGDWPDYDRNSSWAEFEEAQWQFLPVKLQHGRKKHEPKHIMPFLEKRLMKKGGSSTLYRVLVHRDFDGLHPNRQSPMESTWYVLKTYTGARAKKYYTIETENFQRIQQRGKEPDGLIKYHCAYQQNDTYNILLKYAIGGSLEDYMKLKEPRTARAIAAHWKGFESCMMGLQTIHTHTRTDSDEGFDLSNAFQGLHQDICPSNILLVDHPDHQDSDFPYRMVLADLGLTHFDKYSDQREVYSSYIGETYGAPESFRRTEHDEASEHSITPKIDIWALGCVILEIATWLVLGLDERWEFAARRVKETEETENKGDRFHTGRPARPARLQCVSDQIQDVRAEIHNNDKITGHMLNLADSMLNPDPKERPDIKTVRQKAEGSIRDAEISFAQDPPRQRHRGITPGALGGIQPSERESVISSSGPDNNIGNEELSYHPCGPINAGPSHGSTLRREQEHQAPLTVRTSNIVQSPSTSIDHPPSDRDPLSGQSNGAIDEPYPPSSSRVVGSRIGLLPTLPGAQHQIEVDTTAPPELLTQDPQQPNSPPLVHTPVADCGASLRPSTSSRPNGAPRGRSESQASGISIRTAERWITKVKDWRKSALLKRFTAEPPEQLHANLENLRKRHHIFLVDNAESMRHHHTNLKRLFAVMVNVIAYYDKDTKIEVCFTNSTKRYKEKDPDKLISQLHRLDFHGNTNIDDNLRAVAETYKLSSVTGCSTSSSPFPSSSSHNRSLSNSVKALFGGSYLNKSLYILTDAKWDGGGDGKPFTQDMQYALHREGQTKERFGMQFVQFGDDKTLRRRLKDLDDMPATDEASRRKLDIADTVEWRGDIRKILLGSFMNLYDMKHDRDGIMTSGSD